MDQRHGLSVAVEQVSRSHVDQRQLGRIVLKLQGNGSDIGASVEHDRNLEAGAGGERASRRVSVKLSCRRPALERARQADWRWRRQRRRQSWAVAYDWRRILARRRASAPQRGRSSLGALAGNGATRSGCSVAAGRDGQERRRAAALCSSTWRSSIDWPSPVSMVRRLAWSSSCERTMWGTTTKTISSSEWCGPWSRRGT